MSSQFLLPCTCGKTIRVSVAQAGASVMCECGARATVPTMRGLRNLPVAPPLAEARAKPTWSAPRGFAFGLSLLVMAIGSVLAGYHAVQYARIAEYAVDRSAEYAQHDAANTEAEIQKTYPADALDIFREIEQLGLGERPTLLWAVAQQQVKVRKQWIAASGAAIICAALVALGALYVGR